LKKVRWREIKLILEKDSSFDGLSAADVMMEF
jgi:hypothetical protein